MSEGCTDCHSVYDKRIVLWVASGLSPSYRKGPPSFMGVCKTGFIRGFGFPE